MAVTYRSRMVQVNLVVFDQVDIFQSDFFTRVNGLGPGGVTSYVTLDNTVATWPLVDGTTILDTQIAAGSIYWRELSNGAYGIRFFPNSIGHWRLAISYSSAPTQIIALDYDVVNMPISVDTGLRADFCS